MTNFLKLDEPFYIEFNLYKENLKADNAIHFNKIEKLDTAP